MVFRLALDRLIGGLLVLCVATASGTTQAGLEESTDVLPTYNLADGVREVKRSGRPVFAVAYSDTCPICQGLLRTIRDDASLHPIAAQFVNVRINVESPEFRTWELRYPRPSTAIPGVYVVDSDGKSLSVSAGGLSADQLRELLMASLTQTGRMPTAEVLKNLSEVASEASRCMDAGDFSAAVNVLQPVTRDLAKSYDALSLSAEGRQVLTMIGALEEHGRTQLSEALQSTATDDWRSAWTIATMAGAFAKLPGMEADMAAAKAAFSRDATRKQLLRQATEVYRAQQQFGPERSTRGRRALEKLITRYDGEPAAQQAAAILANGAAKDAIAATPTSPPIRTWTDRTGKFSIVAEFVSTSGDLIQLRKQDGTTISVPLSKLDDSAREFVAAQDPQF